MQTRPDEYYSHFREYDCKIHKIPAESERLLSAIECSILKEYGLPDRGLPFFNFDLHLHLLRDNTIPGCRMILGSGSFQGNDEYIFLHDNGCVYYKEKNHPMNYVNASLEQLIDSVFTYSQWLEELENRSDIIHHYVMSEEDIFEIYYALRSIDKRAVQGHHIWNCLIQFDTPKREFLAPSSL